MYRLDPQAAHHFYRWPLNQVCQPINSRKWNGDSPSSGFHTQSDLSPSICVSPGQSGALDSILWNMGHRSFTLSRALGRIQQQQKTDSPILARYRDKRPNSSSRDWSSGRWGPSVATLGRSSTHASTGGSGPRFRLTGRGGDLTKKAHQYIQKG